MPLKIATARTYICDGCGAYDVWGPTWRWYGSDLDLDEGNPVVFTCSVACRAKIEERCRRVTPKRIRRAPRKIS